MKNITPKKKAPRPKMTVDECIAKLSSEFPALLRYVCVDRDWVWICTKVKKSEFGEDTPKKLYALGFRATKKKEGHPIEGTDRVGWWGNACQKPTPFFKRSASNATSSVTSDNTTQDADVDELYAQLMTL